MDSSNLIPVRVQAMRFEAQNIVSVEFVSPNGDDLPAFEAGSHIDLHLGNGLTRSYSLSNSPKERKRYVVGILNDKNSRGGSRYVHEQLRVGSVIQISAPRNNFPVEESAPHSVFIAGGIGITPMFCMFNHLSGQGKSVEMLYCARSRSEAAFADELLSKPNVSSHFDTEKGSPPDLKGFLASKSKDAHFYCCGPTPMIDAFEKFCEELGIENVHVERFAAAENVETVQEDEYVAELKASGKTITVPAGKSLLDAILDSGVHVEYSCREGVCGACETKVLEGTPDHRDAVLTKKERESNKTMMVCVSGCKGKRLVLDV